MYTTDVRFMTKSEVAENGDVAELDSSNSGVPSTTTAMSAAKVPAAVSANVVTVAESQPPSNAMSRMDSSASAAETKQEQVWYDDLSDPQLDDFEEPSDGDDYEDTYVKKKAKKSKKATGTGERKTGRRPHDIPDSEKPYICQHCGAKYKTKPGLHYHLTHVHINEFNEEKERARLESANNAASVVQPIRHDSSYSNLSSVSTTSTISASDSVAPPAEPKGVGKTRTVASAQPLRKPKGEPNQYCDFCLGDASSNKKTNLPEELINCNDCGRAGHPSCLQFTANMIISTKKYGWQCIECKSCAMCGTSENDDQLLFCDDCDRGFHMYCLQPPLSAPPEGNWSCHLCVVAFGASASRPAPGLKR